MGNGYRARFTCSWKTSAPQSTEEIAHYSRGLWGLKLGIDHLARWNPEGKDIFASGLP